MVEDMESRNFSPKIIKAYLGHVTAFAKLLGRSPAEMGKHEIRRYLQYLRKEKKVSWSNTNIAYCALKFFYGETRHREFPVKKIPRPKGEKKLPVVLSYSEIKAIFDAIDNLKHRVILMTTYSGGLRVSEVANLRVCDIDSKQIRVNQGKGKKDRYTLLSSVILEHLRMYWREYRPSTWLFPGSHNDKPLHVTAIQRVFQLAKKKPI